MRTKLKPLVSGLTAATLVLLGISSVPASASSPVSRGSDISVSSQSGGIAADGSLLLQHPPTIKQAKVPVVSAPKSNMGSVAHKLPSLGGQNQPRTALTTCSPSCYYYVAGIATPSTAQSGWYSAMDIYKPTLNVANGYHTLLEMVIKNASGDALEIGWNVDPTVNAGDTKPHLFGSAWTGTGGFQGYNTGFASNATCGGITPTLTPGSLISGTYPQLKKFGIEHTGTWPTGAWFFAYDSGWAGCMLDSWLASKGAVNFSTGTTFQAFGEVASMNDLSAGTPPCDGMGSNTKGSLTNTVTPNAARIANTSYQGGSTLTPSLTLSIQGPGTVSTYYNYAQLLPAGGGAWSGRSFWLGGKGPTGSPC